MLKVLTISINFFFCIILFPSCNSREADLLGKIDTDSILPDEYLIQGISPLYREGGKEEYKFYSAGINKSTNLNLDSLELGYKDFQIRVWLGHSMAIVKQIAIIKRTEKKWDGQLIILTGIEDGTRTNVEIKSVSPKSGWNSLLTRLNDLGIFTLKDSYLLPGYDAIGGGDGISYDFEIATPTKYRIYMYGDLTEYQDKYPEVKNVQTITELLEKEFDFKITR
jgi:hypothetical protein